MLNHYPSYDEHYDPLNSFDGVLTSLINYLERREDPIDNLARLYQILIKEEKLTEANDTLNLFRAGIGVDGFPLASVVDGEITYRPLAITLYQIANEGKQLDIDTVFASLRKYLGLSYESFESEAEPLPEAIWMKAACETVVGNSLFVEEPSIVEENPGLVINESNDPLVTCRKTAAELTQRIRKQYALTPESWAKARLVTRLSIEVPRQEWQQNWMGSAQELGKKIAQVEDPSVSVSFPDVKIVLLHVCAPLAGDRDRRKINKLLQDWQELLPSQVL